MRRRDGDEHHDEERERHDERGVDERTIGRSGLAKRQEVVGEAGEDDERAADPVKRQAERLENERERENAEADDGPFEALRGDALIPALALETAGFRRSCTHRPPGKIEYVRLSRLGAESQRVSGLDADFARHDDPNVAAERSAGVNQRLRAHRLNQFGLARDGVGARRFVEDERSRPDADSDLALRQLGHRRDRPEGGLAGRRS